ncbi:MAG: hypothetical protein NZ742_02055 [Acidobacteria bacterium]|nr:hypothetical protein [Acidobacteriota bacterium]MDW7983618.1 hypothetical protein [Acidobacteriota bacterium]
MEALWPVIHSTYPRVGDSPGEQKLRRAIAAWEQRQISDEELRQVEDEVARQVIAEQEQAGLAVVSDGLVRWYCPFSHLARKLANVQIDGLLRYFDTNFYFRQPVVSGPIQWREPILLHEFTVAQAAATRPVKIVLTGPYTMARYSIVQTPLYQGRLERLAEDYAVAWAMEVRQLVQAGLMWLQVEEPALLHAPQDASIVAAALEILAEVTGPAKIALALYWGDIKPLWPRIQRWPVDMLILDFVYSPLLLDVIAAEGSARPLGLGLLDGRNTRLEDSADILRQLDRLAPRLKGTHHLTTSCGVELLPRDRARAKIERVACIAQSFTGGR